MSADEKPLSRREALALERAAAESAPGSDHHRYAAAEHRHAHAASPRRAARERQSVGSRWQPHLHTGAIAVVSAPQRRSWSAKQWARGLAGAGLVVGLFVTVALPAYSVGADGSAFAASDMFSSSQQLAQTVDVAASAQGQSASTDGYSSESASQLAAARIQAVRSASGYVPPSQSAGDDYPYWDQTPDSYGGGLSPFGYFYRECVDFVAWRLNRDVGSTSAPWRYTWHNLASGSAYMWYSAWVSKGWPTSDIPVPGAVAWFPYNHVSYVKSVNADGSVNIEEYNQQSDHLYHSRTIAASEAVYLYPPG